MRRNPPAKWVLPEAVDPPGVKCFVIQVPDDPQHVAAFRGALLNLASAYKWADDATHMAKDVALRWRQAIEDMTECDMAIMLRTNPFDSCGAQVSYDGGTVWEEFFNARSCAVDTVRDVLGNETPPGGSDPGDGECFAIDMVINGNSRKPIPLAVASGWTLTITQLAGAWWDGNISNYWQCATGYQYALGTCTNNYIDGQSGDPIPSGAKHMQLILQLADGTYAAVNLDGTAYTVPSGQPAGNYFLLPNDSSLGDNEGSISLHIVACSPGWCSEIDFTASDGGFAAILDAQNQQPLAAYVSGVGWTSVYQTAQNDVIAAITRTFASNFTPTSIEWVYTASIVGGGNNGYVFEAQSVNPAMNSGPSYLFGLTGASGDLVQAYIYANYNGSTGNVIITKVRFRGVSGSRPVEQDCT